MHHHNELVWNVLKDTVGEEEAVLFARSASVGAQKLSGSLRRLGSDRICATGEWTGR